MLYSEFVEGTGCKENDHNYQVYKNLEIMYMNSNMTKAEIYEYGKKLVDNSKTEQELAFEANIKAELQEHKNTLKKLQNFLNSDLDHLKSYKEWKDDWGIQYYTNSIKYRREQIKEEREAIRKLKWVLA